MLGRTCLAIAVIVAAGCGVDDGVVAKVGHREISQAEFQQFLVVEASLEWQEADAKVASRLLDRFLSQEALFAAAEVDRPGDSATERWSRLREAMSRVCGDPPEVAADDLQTEIGRRMTTVTPPRVLARQILVDDRETADEASQKILAGEDFLEVSKIASRAPNAADGGTIGWVSAGTLVEELDAVLFALAPGEVSSPVQGPGGFHLFQVLEVESEGTPDLAQVTATVERELSGRAASEHLRRCSEEVCTKVGVRVFPQHLWFAYSGRFAEVDDGSR